MDRGYNDYRLFNRWTTEGVGFATRLKGNALWASHEERPVKSSSDQPNRSFFGQQ
jgi:hypothetical protein